MSESVAVRAWERCQTMSRDCLQLVYRAPTASRPLAVRQVADNFQTTFYPPGWPQSGTKERHFSEEGT